MSSDLYYLLSAYDMSVMNRFINVHLNFCVKSSSMSFFEKGMEQNEKIEATLFVSFESEVI